MPDAKKSIQELAIRWANLNGKKNKFMADWEAERNRLQDEIFEAMDEVDTDSFDLVLGVKTKEGPTEQRPYKLKRIRPRKILWKVEEMKARFTKQDMRMICDKTYEITNWPAVAELLKSHGVKAKEFLQYVNIVETVNDKKIDDLAALGVVKIEDLVGCYEIQESKPYVRLFNGDNSGGKKDG